MLDIKQEKRDNTHGLAKSDPGIDSLKKPTRPKALSFGRFFVPSKLLRGLGGGELRFCKARLVALSVNPFTRPAFVFDRVKADCQKYYKDSLMQKIKSEIYLSIASFLTLLPYSNFSSRVVDKLIIKAEKAGVYGRPE